MRLLQVHTEHLTEPCPMLAGTMGPLSYLHPAVTDACRAFNQAFPVLAGTERLTEPCSELVGTEEPLSYLHPAVTDACRAFN